MKSRKNPYASKLKRPAATAAEINHAFNELKETTGPSLLKIRVNKGARAELGRPKSTPVENRDALMKRLR